MDAEGLKVLEKDVKKHKRIANEWASQLHDLVEDRLPADFEQIHDLAQSTYDACKAWKEAVDRLQTAQQQA